MSEGEATVSQSSQGSFGLGSWGWGEMGGDLGYDSTSSRPPWLLTRDLPFCCRERKRGNLSRA